ncbi:plasmid replication protein RepC [Lentilitoribacter sp. EG35]|uniref:plasmid replication protein RepC n=1 Tax=Lentilitoribacter sp. EG35 TaxID=3234192 RepID=UPI0034612A9C
MTNNGWRKPTPGLVVAEKHAQVGERLSISKTKSIVSIKRVASALGLKSADVMLLDCFAAFTKAQDWEQGRRPIVWASNNYLMEQTGFSLAALRRHIRRLLEHGVIWVKDSANGKRYGHRDDEGYIIEAYGFDLSPLAARAEEFEVLHAQLQEERQFCKSLRTSLTVSRRIMRAKIDKALDNGLRGPWRTLKAEYEGLIDMLPGGTVSSSKLLNILDVFNELKLRIEEAFENAFDWPETADDKNPRSESSEADDNDALLTEKDTPKSLKNETHILYTNQPNLVTSNINETRKKPKAPAQTPATVEPDMGEDDINWGMGGEKRLSTEVDISTVMQACPKFAEMAHDMGGYLHDWNEFHRMAGQIRPMAGISEDAWNVSQRILGPHIAAAAVALIFDKYSSGEVSSPGGYLRGIVDKHKSGDLHLARSFYGRLNEARAVM